MYEEEMRILNDPEQLKKNRIFPGFHDHDKKDETQYRHCQLQAIRINSFECFLKRSKNECGKMLWCGDLCWYAVDLANQFAAFYAREPAPVPQAFFQMDIMELPFPSLSSEL